MHASLAMIVCFVGFQGIVPQSWESASAAGSMGSDRQVTGTRLLATGTVGASLLTPMGAFDALNPLRTRDAFSVTDASGSDDGITINTTGTVTGTAGTAERRPAEGTLFAPVDDLVPTSPFGVRTSPITGEHGEFHTGQDYAAPCGTPVHAADAGTVRAVGWHPWGGGNRVEIDHGNGLITSYNHLEAISVVEGDTVNGGEPIATLGTTGSSTGCHLHFETILDGEHVDPLTWRLVPTEHGPRTGELKDYSPGAVDGSAVPEWAQSSTRSDQPAPADVPDASAVPAASDVLEAGSGQVGGSAAPGVRQDVPANDSAGGGQVPPRQNPSTPAPKPPTTAPAPAPKPPVPTPAPAPKPPTTPSPAPKPPAPAPEPPVQTPKPPTTPSPIPVPAPTPVPTPTPTPTPVPTPEPSPDPSCDVEPGTPVEPPADGSAPQPRPVAPTPGPTPTSGSTPTSGPTATPAPGEGEDEDPETPPCDPEEPVDPETPVDDGTAAVGTPGASPTSPSETSSAAPRSTTGS